MGPDVEEGGARSRGGLEVDAQVAPLPTRRHVDRRLHLSQTQDILLWYCGCFFAQTQKAETCSLSDSEGQFTAQVYIIFPDPISLRLVSGFRGNEI